MSFQTVAKARVKVQYCSSFPSFQTVAGARVLRNSLIGVRSVNNKGYDCKYLDIETAAWH